LFGRVIFLAHAASLRHTSFFARPKSVRFLHSFTEGCGTPPDSARHILKKLKLFPDHHSQEAGAGLPHSKLGKHRFFRWNDFAEEFSSTGMHIFPQSFREITLANISHCS
jgi:hypothetical protein